MSVRALALVILLPGVLAAQVTPRRPARPDTTTRRDTLARGDTLPRRAGEAARAGRDTTPRDSVLVRWAEPDSVMQSLMSRPGYTVTRFQGITSVFDATNHAFEIVAGDSVRAAVQRGDQTVVTDSLIIYDEGSKVATVRGARIVVSDPSSGQADIVSSGTITYNLATGSAFITNPRFPVENGETWYVQVDRARMVTVPADSGRAGRVFYGRGGTITSCEDSIPDYFFLTKEIKKTAGNTIVARPAILYIKDIPVMWLPFIFQDTRSGRRSGVLTPRFGLNDIVRNSPNMRRSIEDIGYYFAINDYMDARVALDWLSSAGAQSNEVPGYVKLKGEWSYNWLDRFLNGHIATDYGRFRDGQTNLAVTWNHSQDFSRNSHLTTNVNYVTSTMLQRDAARNPYEQTATIRSSVNYSHKLGPAALQLGGTRTQYPGRSLIDQNLPTLTLSTGPLSLASWLVWTPNLSYSLSQRLHIDQPGVLGFRYTVGTDGSLDSTAVNRNESNQTLSFDTPIQIFGYDLRNSFSVNDRRQDYPQPYDIVDVNTGEIRERRILPRTYATSIDWTPNFTLPPFMRSLFNISPGVSLSNVMPGAFWVRSPLSNGKFVHQSKRPTFSLSATPTVYGFFPGFGPFSRLRHSITPSISYTYAPPASIDTAFLRALNQSAAGTRLAGLRQSALSFGLTQNIEAKVRSPNDTSPEAGEKIKLLSLQFSSLSYDFERAKATGKAIRGLSTDQFSYTLSSDLLPQFQMSVGYSLFKGSPLSDTAVFSPYRERVSASLRLSRDQNPFVAFTRLFGRAVPVREPNTEPVTDRPDEELTRDLSNQPVAGSGRRSNRLMVPPTNGWDLSLTFSSSRQRPLEGTNVVDFDPTARCEVFRDVNPVAYQTCVTNAQIAPTNDAPTESPLSGGQISRIPPTTSVGAQTNFQFTQNWSASWSTNYDVVRHQFAMHTVALQRNLHDWRATFGFTQAPSGTFSFSFQIALKAQPDIQFPYNRTTYRTGESR